MFARKKDLLFSLRKIFFFRFWCGFSKTFAQQTESKWRCLFGGSAIDFEWVQVHPTGLVKISAENEKIKFLAAEALRGVEGLLIDKNGKLFCNKLERRDYITGLMWKNEQPFRLILNKKASEDIIWHCKHYLGRGFFFRRYETFQIWT